MAGVPANERAEARRDRPGRRLGGLWGATAVSSLGDGLALVAFPLLAASITTDTRLVAGVLIAQRLPWLLVALGAGALVDRRNRRRTMVISEVVRGIALALFALAVAGGAASLPLLYAAAFLIGAGDTVLSAGVHAALPEIVPRDRFERANGLLFSTQTAGEHFAGTALGGVLFATAAALPFGIDATTFVLSAALLAVSLPAPKAPSQAPPPALRVAVREGLAHFRGDPLLRMLGAVVAGFAFLQAMVYGVLVLFGGQALALSEAGYGLLLAVGAIGNVAGGLIADRLVRAAGTGSIVVMGGFAVGLAYLGLAAAPHLPGPIVLAGAALFVEALAIGIANVATLSLRQRVVPEDLLGRVGNTFRVLVYGAIPLGALAGGLLAGGTSLIATVAAAGGLQVVLVIATAGPLRRRIAAASPAAGVQAQGRST